MLEAALFSIRWVPQSCEALGCWVGAGEWYIGPRLANLLWMVVLACDEPSPHVSLVNKK